MHVRNNLLNFGAGNPVNSWINMDSSPLFLLPRFVHRVFNIFHCCPRSVFFLEADYLYCKFRVGKTLPLPDHSCQVIYTSHVLEHLSVPEIFSLINEFSRIIAPGGILRLIVPDLQGCFNKNVANAANCWLSLEETLLTLPPELKTNKLRAILEAYHGFPSFHKTAILANRIRETFQDKWNIRENLSYLESDIEQKILQSIESRERCEHAIIFELIPRR